MELEGTHGLAVCDTDPFKLHYISCEWRSGLCPDSEWRTAVDMNRRAFDEHRWGLADAVVFLAPDESVVRQQRMSDQGRRRRRFEKHLRFRPWLVESYQAFDYVDSGRVLWKAPHEPLPGSVREPRTGLELFDAFMSALANVTDTAPSAR